jgi:ATP-dependent Clp protease adaptor protein ClpS
LSLKASFFSGAIVERSLNHWPIFTNFGGGCRKVARRKSLEMQMNRMVWAAVTFPGVKEVEKTEEVTVHVPLYNVVLLDDDHHTYDYVIEMLGHVFGHSIDRAYQMACEVDAKGRVIVDTTHLDRAELKRDQIHSFGADWRMPQSKGGMSAEIEPAL